MNELGKWFVMWLEDKRSILDTMQRNMIADLEAGYNPNGYSILKQKVDMMEYEMEMDRRIDDFGKMTDKQIERWCYSDMRRRGAI